jgi:hypothetical protein
MVETRPGGKLPGFFHGVGIVVRAAASVAARVLRDYFPLQRTPGRSGAIQKNEAYENSLFT